MNVRYLVSCVIFIQFLTLIFNSEVCGQNKQAHQIPWTVDWNPKVNLIAVGGETKGLKIYNKNLNLIKSIPFDNNITRVKWHPHKEILAIVSQLESDSSKGRLYYPKQDKWIDLPGLKEGARGLSWSNLGNYLAVGDNNGNISIYNSEGELIRKFNTDPKAVLGISWHPRRDIFVSVGSVIGIYNIDGSIIKKFRPNSIEILMLCVEWHPTDNIFAVGDYGDSKYAENKRIIIWSSTGEKIAEITGSEGGFRNIRWNSNGNKLAGATDALRIWDKNGKLIAESKSSDNYLWGIDWSPDGKYLITSSSNGFITLWNEYAKTIKTIEY